MQISTFFPKAILLSAALFSGAGAAIGAIAGNAGLGAAIGAGTGLVGSYLYDKHKQSEQRAYEQGYRQGRQPQPQTNP